MGPACAEVIASWLLGAGPTPRQADTPGRIIDKARDIVGAPLNALSLGVDGLHSPGAGVIITRHWRPAMRNFSAVIERDPETGFFVGFVPGFPGAHSQGATLDELNAKLREVITMLLEDGEPVLESKFVGVQNVAIA